MVDYFSASLIPTGAWRWPRLMGDLFLRLGEARHAARAGRRAHGPRCCLPISYDMSATWPKPSRWSGSPRTETLTNDLDMSLADAVERLSSASRADGPRVLESLLDRMEPPCPFRHHQARHGRADVSAFRPGLAKQALAEMGTGCDVQRDRGNCWHGLSPLPIPSSLPGWTGRGEKAPRLGGARHVPPVMLSTADRSQRTGRRSIRPTMRRNGSGTASASRRWRRAACDRLYTRTGDDISGTFPDVLQAMDFEGPRWMANCWSAHRRTTTASFFFPIMQQRLNRKSVSDKQMKAHPAFVRCYDLLHDGISDLRPLPFAQRRERLETFIAQLGSPRFDLSPLVEFGNWEKLEALRSAPPHPVIEGVMLKRHDSSYVPGRPRGPLFSNGSATRTPWMRF